MRAIVSGGARYDRAAFLRRRCRSKDARPLYGQKVWLSTGVQSLGDRRRGERTSAGEADSLEHKRGMGVAKG
jgi:hypothetical protein